MAVFTSYEATLPKSIKKKKKTFKEKKIKNLGDF